MKTSEKIENWAEVRNIVSFENRFVQLAKVMEELGELAKAIIEKDQNMIIDSLGDVQITLTILAQDLGLSLEECTEIAFEEIKNRTGKIVNGSFVRDK